MKPFYQADGITIYCGKAEEVIRHLEAERFGVLIMDPPFTYSEESIERFESAMRSGAETFVLGSGSITIDSLEVDMSPKPAFGHPNVRPLRGMKKLLALTQGPILDPYMGTGTTLLAARELGREAVGIELKIEHCKTAVERLQQIHEFAFLNP